MSVSSTKHHLFIILAALVGFLLALFATSRHGAGLSPDSVGYIATARSIMAGAGALTYHGGALLEQPPLYPALLALGGVLTGMDPLSFAHGISAFLFGVIIYSSGVLLFHHLSSFPAFAALGTCAVVFSVPVFQSATQAWSEPLFIALALLSIVFAYRYLARNDLASLVLLAVSVALASLTRYIGVSLILWGALVIFLYRRNRVKTKILHASLFAVLSALPLGLWFVRNYLLSGTFAGPRNPSEFTLFENITKVFMNFLYFYIPRFAADNRFVLTGIVAAIVVLSIIGRMVGSQDAQTTGQHAIGKHAIGKHIGLHALFVLVYTVFLVASSTIVAYDAIEFRLLSPVYVPLTIVLLGLLATLAARLQARFSHRLIHEVLLIGVVIWLAYPVLLGLRTAKNQYDEGRGYTSKAWRESQTVQYLRQHEALASECVDLYTNDPWASYILTGLVTEMVPFKTSWRGTQTFDDTDLVWPEAREACLIWYNQVDRPFLYTLDELQAVATLDPVALLEDGSIYSVSRE